MDISTLALQQAFGSSIYFKCSNCHTKTLIPNYQDFYERGCRFQCPVCDYKNFKVDSNSMMVNSSIRTDSDDAFDYLDRQIMACAALSWMVGSDRNDLRSDANGSIQQAQREAIAAIEGATRNYQPLHRESRSDDRSDRTTAFHEDVHEDVHEGGSAIKQAQEEMRAEIEAQSRQHRR